MPLWRRRPFSRSVGWVERSETHRPLGTGSLMGIAALNPSYGSSAGRIRGGDRAHRMQAADIIAIVLVLGAIIGCLNSLYFRLPPAIGVLLGSLVLSALIVTTDRLFSLHVLGWFRSTLDS